MSVSAHSRLVIGFRLNKSDVVRNEPVRQCNHDVPSQARFCPHCGKPVWKERERRLVDMYDDNDMQPFYIAHGNTCANGRSEYCEEYLVVGQLIKNGSWDPLDPLAGDMDTLKNSIAEALTSRGVNPDNGVFGVHAVLYFG